MADEMAEQAEAEEIDVVDVDLPEGEETEDEEITVSIGDEESPASEETQEQPAPEWVKDLRKAHRELKRENNELKAKLTVPAETQQPVAIGAKPKLEDFDYDAEQYEQSLASWYDRKRAADDEQLKARAAEDRQKAEWQTKIDGYNTAKAKLKVRDYEDAEMVAQEALSVTQQGIILHGSDNPALLTYALGKNPTKVKELAAINDPVKFAFAVAKLEKELKVSNRKAPPPEGKLSGSAAISGAVAGSTLDRLKTEAQRTGNYEKYFAAKRKSK